jgi:hypothetical protein
MSRYYSDEYKRLVVSYCTTHHRHQSYSDIAKQFDIKGGKRTVQRWMKQSHIKKKVNKQKRNTILNKKEMNEYIYKKIKKKNQQHTSIHYRELLKDIKTELHKEPSLRTIQRYGQQKFGIKQKRTITRTVQECKRIYIT